MLRDIFTNKWILGGIAFLIIIAGWNLLSNKYFAWQYEKEVAKTVEYARQWEKDRKTKQERSPDPETASPQAPVDSETPDAEKQRTPVTKDTELVHAQNEPETAKTDTEVRVSPYGFGPYPEIPEGAPIGIFEESDSVEMELLGRVMVKKWNEGERFEGAGIKSGKVYLHYPNTIYVRWKEKVDMLDGTKTYRISEAFGAEVPLTSQQMRTGEIPPGITVLNADSAGFDPYEVLSLPKKE